MGVYYIWGSLVSINDDDDSNDDNNYVVVVVVVVVVDEVEYDDDYDGDQISLYRRAYITVIKPSFFL